MSDAMRAALCLATLLALGCAGLGSGLGREARIARLEVESRELLSRVRLLRVRANAVAADFARAEAAFDRARRSYASSSQQYQAAAHEFDRAANEFRWVTAAALVYATLSAGSGFCADHMSTAMVRRRLRSEGIDLHGLDVDHVWPRALGGADHLANYQVITSSLNRSLGARIVEKFVSMPIAMLQGLASSALDAALCGG